MQDLRVSSGAVSHAHAHTRTHARQEEEAVARRRARCRVDERACTPGTHALTRSAACMRACVYVLTCGGGGDRAAGESDAAGRARDRGRLPLCWR
jgi:hypothetical protein